MDVVHCIEYLRTLVLKVSSFGKDSAGSDIMPSVRERVDGTH